MNQTTSWWIRLAFVVAVLAVAVAVAVAIAVVVDCCCHILVPPKSLM